MDTQQSCPTLVKRPAGRGQLLQRLLLEYGLAERLRQRQLPGNPMGTWLHVVAAPPAAGFFFGRSPGKPCSGCLRPVHHGGLSLR